MMLARIGRAGTVCGGWEGLSATSAEGRSSPERTAGSATDRRASDRLAPLALQCSHDADAREHHRSARRRHQGSKGGNNDQVCVVHCHRRLCPLSFIGRSRQEETARSGGQIRSGANRCPSAKKVSQTRTCVVGATPSGMSFNMNVPEYPFHILDTNPMITMTIRTITAPPQWPK